MSNFQSTVSIVAALLSIFGAGAAGWKLAQGSSDVPPSALDQKIEELEKKLEEATAGSPAPVVETQPQQQQVANKPEPPVMPIFPPTPPAPVAPETNE